MDLLNNIIEDYYKFLSIDEIANKYKEFNVSPYIIKKIIKENRLNRERPTKFLKIFKNETKTNIKEDMKEDINNAKLNLYDERKIKNHLPKNLKIDIIKKEPDINMDANKQIQEILKDTSKTLNKVRNKK